MFAEEKTVSAECVQKVHEPVVEEPRYLGVPKCGTGGRSTMEAESGDEEECEEEDEDAAEVCAPIELLAEVRHHYIFMSLQNINMYTMRETAEAVCFVHVCTCSLF